MFGFAGVVSADVNPVTPSTNDINRTKGWAHVDQLSKDVGATDLQFISTRGFYSCFEYRTDGDTNQATGDPNYNTDITDGLYPYYCQNNDSSIHTISANEYVEVRMVFGAETDERFDWTRFDVLPIPFIRSAEITFPTVDEEVSGMVSFDATLTDEDGNDNVQWAVRKGTCAAATGTVFGNVDGYTDDYDWNGADFHALADTSSWIPGDYCFIFNPTESAGDTPIRETREFVLKDTVAPLVTIESPSEGNEVSGTIEIYGTVVEDYLLSHYNISVYPGDADFSDFSKRIAQTTVYRSTGFTNELIFEWDSTGWDDGEYLIRLAARDSAGNRSYDGDPYLGGDDSQHVIRITIDNAQEAEGRGCYFDRQSRPRWNCDQAVLMIFDDKGEIVLDINELFSGEWEVFRHRKGKIIEIYRGKNAEGKRIVVIINHRNGRVTASGRGVWFKGRLVE